jgi:hypothetical protein
MVGWWRAEGDGNDALGTNNGTLQGGVGFTSGEVSQAFALDGNNSYIMVPGSSSLNVGASGSFTIECWIWPDDISVNRPITEWNAGGNLGPHLWLSQPTPFGTGPGCIYANLVDTGGNFHYLSTPAGLIGTSSFQHVALTYDHATGIARIFVDGANAAQATLGVFTCRTSYPLFIGARPAGNPVVSFSGLMDEVSLYKRALSAAEIQALYDAGSSGKCLAPIILQQPAAQTTTVGGSVNFRVDAYGAGPFTYQWHFNGSDIGDATNSIFSISSVQSSNAGPYSVTVANPYDSILSSNAVLTVNLPACAAPASGLVGWWQCEGNALDSLGLNPGTLQGSASFAAGKVGQALLLFGTNGSIQIPSSAAMNVGTNSGFSAECWINPNDVSINRPIVEWNSSGSFGPHLWLSQPGPFGTGAGCLFANIIDTSGNNHFLTTTPGLVTSNSFQHVALTYDKTSGLGSIFLNGNLVIQQNLGSFTPRTTYPLYLGARPAGSPTLSFAGLLDEASLYSRALTSNEVRSIYFAQQLGKCGFAPTIVLQPTNQTVAPAATVTLTSGVSGSQPLTLQWRFNGTNISGATNASLTITNAQPSKAGNYSLAATNSGGFAISSNAVLKVKVISVFGNSQPLTNSQYTFASSVSIQLQNAYPGGYTFYTLDGSTPDGGSTFYTGPFVLTSNAVLRAIGYRSDFVEAGLSDPIGILVLPSFTLTASTAGGGTITLNPASGPYITNSVVQVVATPNSGWMLLGWQGDLNGTNLTNSVTMNRNRSIQAVFGTTLTITVGGLGTIVKNPTGPIYAYGTQVQISAIPQSGQRFTLWSSDGTGSANPLLFTITNANPTVSSLFGSLSGGQVSLAVVPTGHGHVAKSPDNNTYNLNQSVTVTASADTNHAFLGWSGDASGSQNPLIVSMSQSKIIYANFSRDYRLSAQLPTRSTPQDGVKLVVTGDIGQGHTFQVSSNLTSWTTLGVATNFTGTVEFIDSGWTNNAVRFYRTLPFPTE